MNEGPLIKSINRHLPKILHHQSMTFGSRSFNGTPDRYYDGLLSDLWAEYKVVVAMPRDRLVGGVDDKKRGCYSSLQYDWMLRRYNNGGNVVGIVGLPNRTAVIQTTPEQWKGKSSIEAAMPLKTVAEWIITRCLGDDYGK